MMYDLMFLCKTLIQACRYNTQLLTLNFYKINLLKCSINTCDDTRVQNNSMRRTFFGQKHCLSGNSYVYGQSVWINLSKLCKSKGYWKTWFKPIISINFYHNIQTTPLMSVQILSCSDSVSTHVSKFTLHTMIHSYVCS